MATTIVASAIEALKNISSLTTKVVDAGDAEKYANSINNLCKGVDDTYAGMRKIILESSNFSEEEKIERLQELATQEVRTKEACGDAIRGNRENVANITLEIFKGFLTCGLSFVPALIRSIKNELTGDGQNAEMGLLIESTIEQIE